MSVSRCDVVWFAFAPSAAYLPHQIDGAHTTPGRMRVLDARHRRERAAIVVHHHAHPGADPAPLGVGRMEQALRLARRATQRIDVHESRVQELMRRRRDQRQRIARRERRRASPGTRTAA